jgi:hypothetical protein
LKCNLNPNKIPLYNHQIGKLTIFWQKCGATEILIHSSTDARNIYVSKITLGRTLALFCKFEDGL